MARVEVHGVGDGVAERVGGGGGLLADKEGDPSLCRRGEGGDEVGEVEKKSKL